MRIDSLSLKNFKGYSEREFRFHPEFNLIIGINGSGKTSVLEALSVAMGSWLLGITDSESRHIRASEVQLACHQFGSDDYRWERQYPCRVEVSGAIQGQRLVWARALNRANGRTTTGEATGVKSLAEGIDRSVRNGESVDLPLLSYYGTGRLWLEPREYQVTDPQQATTPEELSRTSGYNNSVDPRISVSQLTKWIAQQEWISYRRRSGDSGPLQVVKLAITKCIEGAEDIIFDPAIGEVVVVIDGNPRPFSQLSDGQRAMAALVGDMAQKAVRLNPHLGTGVLELTKGVVLIDELDLHLHPRWQRRIIEDLRGTFPKIQFFCTSHSPFLIQSVRTGEELVVLDGQTLASLGNRSVDDIARGVQGIANPTVSERYAREHDVAIRYLQTLEEAASAPEATRREYIERLTQLTEPFAENPALQAFLEQRRVATLGE